MSGVSTVWLGGIVSAMIEGNADQAVNHGAELLRGDSQPLAPIDTGVLRGTAQVTPASGGDHTAYVSYDTPYAARQHEELGWRHDEGQAKYLEEPLVSNEAKYAQAIASRLGRGL